MRTRHLFVAALVLGLTASRGSADSHPNLARGLDVGTSYSLSDIEQLNNYNGNFVLTIPLGSFRVAGDFGYSLVLTYNSNPWDFQSDCITYPNPVCYTEAKVGQGQDAGLGWTLSMGRFKPSPLGVAGASYISADGSEHVFDESLHEGENGGGAGFTRDGSYLRLVLHPGQAEVSQPNGIVSTFDLPPEQGAEGVLRQIADPFGNYVRIDTAPTADGIRWDITDSATDAQGQPIDRVQKVTFVNDPDLGELGKRVTKVELTAFDTTATYTFHYDWMTPDEPCDDNEPTSVPRSRPMLTSLTLPDGRIFRMPEYYLHPASDSCRAPGALKKLVLPTGGWVTWSYKDYRLPNVHGWGEHPQRGLSNGLATRTLYDRDGTQIGTWRYSTVLLPDIGHPVVVMNTVETPLGDRTEHFFSVATPTQQDPAMDDPAWYIYGLPFDPRVTDASGARFLSSRVYKAGQSQPIRSTYVRYERDSGHASDAESATKYNQRLASTKAVFEDDALNGTPPKFVDTDQSDFDGFGHYRTAVTSDNFGYGPSRTERIGWNLLPSGAAVPAGANWMRGTYGFREQFQGPRTDVARQELDFDSATGALRCARTLRVGTLQDPHDVVVAYGRDSHGNVTSEAWYGGDNQTLSTSPPASGQVCPGLPVAAYSLSHSYAAGVRRLTTATVLAGPLQQPTTLKLLDLDIDGDTGLTRVSRDIAGRPTTFTYDQMGRVKTSSPAGDATATVFYTANQAEVYVGSSPILAHEKLIFDGLGRLTRHEVDGPTSTVAVDTSYNEMGWKIFVSDPSSASGTTYDEYDPFGRPGKITTADGSETTLEYTGTRVVRRSQKVWQLVGETNRAVLVTGREEYDGSGRLMRVREPIGTWTNYTYDEGGRLRSVVTNPGGGGGQWRTFEYDHRGFLTREVTPEGGVTTYDYDAKGNPIAKSSPTRRLLYKYDGAGRLVETSTPQDAPFTRLRYGVDGKLEQAQAYNDRLVANQCTRHEVRQNFAYEPTHGRLDNQTTTLNLDAETLQWKQAYDYDDTGKVTTTTYPYCLSGCPATSSRTRTTSYAFERPTAVSGFASLITYQPNGMVNTIRHANNVVFTQGVAGNGMPRPASLGAKLGTEDRWPTEIYAYDPAGNIRTIGTKSFVYDADSRIVAATVPAAGAAPYKGYSYDVFGNLTAVKSGTGPGSVTTVNYTADPATNRLVGATYDLAGNLVAYQGSTYAWDALQNLASVNTGSESWVHVYDAAGERIWSWRTSGARVDTFALRGQDAKVLTDFTRDASGFSWEDYGYREGQLLGAAFSDGRVVHFDVDHLGSVRLETDANGAVLKYREFWPFGEEATASGSAEQMSFTGHERDLGVVGATADDLDYMHARFYNPLVGRFLSADPVLNLKRTLSMPQGWNRYAYAMGNPVRYIDPDGRDTTGTYTSGASFTSFDWKWSDLPGIAAVGLGIAALPATAVLAAEFGGVAGVTAIASSHAPEIAIVATEAAAAVTGQSLLGPMTGAQSIASGAVRAESGLARILTAVDTSLASGTPKTAEASLIAVTQGAKAAGFGMGIVTSGKGDVAFVAQHSGGLATYVMTNGTVMIMRGTEIVLRYVPPT